MCDHLFVNLFSFLQDRPSQFCFFFFFLAVSLKLDIKCPETECPYNLGLGAQIFLLLPCFDVLSLSKSLQCSVSNSCCWENKKYLYTTIYYMSMQIWLPRFNLKLDWFKWNRKPFAWCLFIIQQHYKTTRELRTHQERCCSQIRVELGDCTSWPCVIFRKHFPPWQCY